MKKSLLFFIYLVFVGFVNAQQFDIDSLEQVISNYKERDSTRASTLLLTSNFIMGKNPEKAIAYAEEGLNISSNIGWEKGKVAGLIQVGSIYYIKTDYIKALDYFQKADKENVKLKDPTISVSIYNALANIYCDIGQYQKGIENYKNLLSYAKVVGDKRYEALALTNIGNVYVDLKDYLKGEDYLKKALHITDSIQYIYFKPGILNNLGIVSSNLNEDDKAIEYFKEGIKYSKMLQDVNNQVASMLSFVKILHGQKKYKEALPLLKEVLPLSEKVGNIEWQNQIRHLLSINYKTQGDYKNALNEYEKHIILKDSVLNDQKKSDIIKKDLEYEMEKQDLISQGIIKRKELTKRYVIIIGISIIVFLIISGILYKKRNDSIAIRKEAEYKADLFQTDLKVLQSKLNPHFIFNALNSIKNYIMYNDANKASNYLTKFSMIMRGIVETSEKQFITLEEDIRFMELYLQIEKSRFDNQLDFNIVTDKDLGDIDNILFPPFILQPIIENSIWHGISSKTNGVGKIEISIRKKDKQTICCMIEDNGVGRNTIEKSKKSNGVGLNIVRDRIAIINREERIDDKVNIFDKEEGVKVYFYLPLMYKF